MKKDEKEAILQLIDKSFERTKEGSIVEGEIVDISSNEVFVDIGAKSEGSVPLNEFADPSSIKVGDKFEFFLEKIVEDEGLVFLSKKKADAIRVWEDIEKSYKEKIPLEGKITKLVKGGCIVEVKGVETFLPGSHLDVKEVRNMEKFVGENVSVRVTRLDASRNNVVVSRRLVLEEELRKQREELWDKLKEGQILEGIVKTIVDFGAFVDIGGIDGLVHIADLSWGRVNHPSEMLKVGDKVKVKVLGVDKTEEHLTLGIKQLTASPWETVEERYPVGTKVKGKVTSLTEYGAFVELEPGIEGLIHISEISWTRIHSPSDVLSIGDTVEVVVLSVEKLNEKISLGLRQTKPNPWEKVQEEYPVGSIVSGTIKSFSKFGAFVELKDGLEGFLHVNDISWDEHIEHPGDVLRKKQRIKCKVLSVDVENQKINLGVKQLEKSPISVLKENITAPVKGRVKEIFDRGIIVKVPVGKHKVEGFVPISQLMKQERRETTKAYGIGKEINLMILEVDEKRHRVILSEKKYYEEEERKDYEEYLKRK